MEIGIIVLSIKTSEYSLTPNPAGAPGIINPRSHEIETIPKKLKNEKLL